MRRTPRRCSLDFHFYRLNPRRVRYIAGFGRMGWVEQAELDALPGLDAGVEADLLATLATQVPDGVCVLGLDACGIDRRRGQRVRERFAERPLQPEAIAGAARDVPPARADGRGPRSDTRPRRSAASSRCDPAGR